MFSFHGINLNIARKNSQSLNSREKYGFSLLFSSLTEVKLIPEEL